MPVILSRDEWALWLDPEIRDEGLLQDLLRPADDDLLRLDAASPLVNNANNEGAELLVPPPDSPPAPNEAPLTLFG
jgi:putative SOS response-associated peptidase YedK